MIRIVEDDASVSSVGQVEGNSDQVSYVEGDCFDSQRLNFNTSIVDDGDSLHFSMNGKNYTQRKMRARFN